ncbi:efflux RND transporter periplasmic adaptor subunit [Rhodohalobacter barkolensis]|nr:efflux RND transporter periplasmic adaptor subunit [Rhodohalobacter barkolensis]
MKQLKKVIIKFLKLTVTALLLFTACSGEPEPVDDLDVSSPPSVTGDQALSVKQVSLTEKQASDLSIEHYRVTRQLFSYPMTVPGIVVAAPEHIAVVSTPVDGRITKIFAHEGEEIRKGEPLLEMESLEFAELAANYLEALAERAYLEQQVQRLSTLVERKISPQSSLDRAAADLSRASTRVRATRARLSAVGIDEQQLAAWENMQENENATLILYAPIDGKINHHMIDLGSAVNANNMLLDIVDNREVLVRGFIDPADIPFLQVGAKAVISQRTNREGSQGAMSVNSEITSIQPGLDQENRAIIANSQVETVDQWPVIGQSVRIEYEANTRSEVIAIPMDAIQFEGQNATVFVKIDDLNYENRPIEIDRLLTDSAIVSSGLTEGEEIAVTQIFSLKALGKFEEFAED